MHTAFFRYALLSVLTVLISSGAQASVLTDLLTFDGPVHHTSPPTQGGGEDKLQDDSLSAFVDADMSGGFSVDDIIFGLINITNVASSGVADVGVGELRQITIMFATKIIGAGSGGSLALGPIADSLSDYDLRNLLAPSLLDDFASGPDDDSIFVVASNETGSTEAGGINPLNLNANVGGAVNANSIETNLTNANGWFGDVVGGILAGDFFEFSGSALLGGTQRGGFSVQETATFPSGTLFLPVDVFNFAATISTHDLTLDVATVNNASAAEASRGWTFRDQGTFYVNAVIPEPASLLVWLALCSALGLVGARRRMG